MQIASVGIDLGKTTFHLVALEKDETVGSARTLSHNHADEISTAFLTTKCRTARAVAVGTDPSAMRLDNRLADCHPYDAPL
jgi:hypothetical protein